MLQTIIYWSLYNISLLRISGGTIDLGKNIGVVNDNLRHASLTNYVDVLGMKCYKMYIFMLYQHDLHRENYSYS